MIFATRPTTNPPPTQQPAGYLGAEYPLIVGIGIGLVIASLKSKSNTNKPTEQLTAVPQGVNNSRNQFNYLSDDDSSYAWVNQVLKLPFRVLSGMQGSGKSTLERFMISELKKDGWYVVCINPETNPQMWKGVEVLANPQDITQFFQDFLEWISQRQQEARDKGIDEDDYLEKVTKNRTGKDGKVAIFLMESNTYEVHRIDPEAWANFLKQCLTNIRKWGFTACLTAHSDNQTSISSKLSGFSKQLDTQPRIDCIAITHPVTLEATSSGEGLLKLKGIKDPNPIKVKLKEYPKTKDFRLEHEKKSELQTLQATENSNTLIEDRATRDSPPGELKDKANSEMETLANYVFKSFLGQGRTKIYQIPRRCKPVRNWLIDKFSSASLDDKEAVKQLHIILGILELQDKVLMHGDKDTQGLIIPSKETEFEIIK